MNEQILHLLNTKVKNAKNATDTTFAAFSLIKHMLMEYERELKHIMLLNDPRIKVKYTDRGTFEAELKVADDVLIFIMHTNAFAFDATHPLSKSNYVSLNPERGVCGMISVYNFMADAMKFERRGELGQLLGRIFINSENHFFVEGKKQIGILFNNFNADTISNDTLKKLIDQFLINALDTDAIVPPMDAMREITVHDALTYMIETSMYDGKKVGFKFRNQQDDDVTA